MNKVERWNGAMLRETTSEERSLCILQGRASFRGQRCPPLSGVGQDLNSLRPTDPRNHEKAAGSSGKLVELKLLKCCTDPPLPSSGRKKIL